MTTVSTTHLLETRPVGKLLLQYSIPAIIGMTVTSLYNIIDSIFIGHGVGPMAISGLAITFPLMNLVIAFCTLMGIGGATITSIFLGQKDAGMTHYTPTSPKVSVLMVSHDAEKTVRRCVESLGIDDRHRSETAEQAYGGAPIAALHRHIHSAGNILAAYGTAYGRNGYGIVGIARCKDERPRCRGIRHLGQRHTAAYTCGSALTQYRTHLAALVPRLVLTQYP